MITKDFKASKPFPSKNLSNFGNISSLVRISLPSMTLSKELEANVEKAKLMVCPSPKLLKMSKIKKETSF
jgi:hypothetical protein